MAKKKPETTEARALVDINMEGERIHCGKTFTAAPEVIAALVDAGQADAAKEAVQAGKE